MYSNQRSPNPSVESVNSRFLSLKPYNLESSDGFPIKTPMKPTHHLAQASLCVHGKINARTDKISTKSS